MASGLAGLFFMAFLSATLLPVASELLLTGMFFAGTIPPLWIWLAATLGNVLGAVVNWLLGRYCIHWLGRRWFPVTVDRMEQARRWFQHQGQWSLLFSWVPIVGDPLTFVAGISGVRFWRFLWLVFLGKGGRYALLLLLLTRV